MSDNISMSYGEYNFSPVPNMTLSRDYKKSDDGRILYTEMKISLNGTLTPFPGGPGGLANLGVLQQELANAFEQQGCSFSVACNGGNILSCNPKMTSFNFQGSPNNWVDSIPYNIDMFYTDNVASEIEYAEYVSSVSENWSMEILEDKPYYTWNGGDSQPFSFKLTHSVSAKGITNYHNDCSTLVMEPWQYAQMFCSNLVTGDTDTINVFSLPDGYSFFNHNRTQREDHYGGQYSIEETWLVFKQGSVAANATEDFVIDIKVAAENNIASATINGTIHGLEARSYGALDVVTVTVGGGGDKYSNALDYWQIVAGSQLPYYRCVQALTNSALKNADGSAIRSLNPLRYDKSVGQNIPNGSISYNYTFTNKPTPCLMGVLSEDITISIDYPQDVFASVPILGRATGPVLQLMGTRTHFGYSMSIDVLVPYIEGCDAATDWSILSSNCPHENVKTLLVELEDNLISNYTMVVKSADKINWKPKEGKYSRSVSWICVPCGDSGTAVSVLA